MSVEQGLVPLAPAASLSDHSLRRAIQVILVSDWLILIQDTPDLWSGGDNQQLDTGQHQQGVRVRQQAGDRAHNVLGDGQV